MMSSTFKCDVIVVGAGPGGSAVAKRCAEHGLKVLLLEKHKLPRHKICSGWLLGSPTQKAVVREFGPVPQHVLTDPPYLSVFIIHAIETQAQLKRGINDRLLMQVAVRYTSAAME